MRIPQQWHDEYNEKKSAIIKNLQDRWLDGKTFDEYQIFTYEIVKGRKSDAPAAVRLRIYKYRKFMREESKALQELDERYKIYLYYAEQEQQMLGMRDSSWNLTYHLCRYALVAINDERKKLEELHYSLRTNRAAIIEDMLYDPVLTNPNDGIDERFDGFNFKSPRHTELLAQETILNEKLEGSRAAMRDAMAMIYPAFSFVKTNFPEFADLLEWAQKQNEKSETRQVLVNDFSCYCKGCQNSKKEILRPFADKLKDQYSMVELGYSGDTPPAMNWKAFKGEAQ